MKKRLFTLLILALLLLPTAAQAKGPFSYLVVSGGDLKQEVRLIDAALMGFGAFAKFPDSLEPPADAGWGYEVVRHFSNGQSDMAFDHLHYHPAAGLTYYDGLVNGYSEYDGRWFAAPAGVRQTFEAALMAQAPVSPLPFAVLTVLLIALAVALRRCRAN
jgi:hypothetical protein